MIMKMIGVTNARKDLYHLVESVNAFDEPILIVGKQGNAVLISENEWNSIQETLSLCSIPGVSESIKKGLDTPLSDCVPEEMVE